MDDNETCHRTLAVQDCLDSEGIQRLVWQARSPDLNPIENVWEALERQVAGRNDPPTNKNTLIRALTEEWDKLPQQLLDNVVQSMKNSGPTGIVVSDADCGAVEGSNPGEDMDVCKCIVPLRQGGTLNSHRAASSLVWLVDGEERWEAPDHPQVSTLKIGVETSQIVLSPVWCSKLRLTIGVT
ncbi:transposable element Tc1 transposase [Trichonephila clavipes]|nr:transposable element Tc1 transposase [Trichonephila clavipes]